MVDGSKLAAVGIGLGIPTFTAAPFHYLGHRYCYLFLELVFNILLLVEDLD